MVKLFWSVDKGFINKGWQCCWEFSKGIAKAVKHLAVLQNGHFQIYGKPWMQ